MKLKNRIQNKVLVVRDFYFYEKLAKIHNSTYNGDKSMVKFNIYIIIWGRGMFYE